MNNMQLCSNPISCLIWTWYLNIFILVIKYPIESSVAFSARGSNSYDNPCQLGPPNDNDNIIGKKSQSTTKSTPTRTIVTRPLTPPFPDGLCGGRIVTLPPSDHYLLDTNLSGNTFLLPPRNIQVWLPPHYDQYPDMRFPVLYCHDGQNAMQDETSWTGYSWRMAGALSRLSERKLLTKTTQSYSPPIVILIPCNDERVIGVVPRRHLEYGDINQIVSQAHADFVALTLKPLVDSTFRTLTSVEHNAVIGSSLGGQAALHLLLRHPTVFGKAACISPAFQPAILAAVVTKQGDVLKDKVVYIDNGGDEDDIKVPFVDLVDFMSENHFWNPGYWWLDSSLQIGIDLMKLALDAKGVSYTYNKFAGGRHNERAWALRIHKPLLALYGDL